MTLGLEGPTVIMYSATIAEVQSSALPLVVGLPKGLIQMVVPAHTLVD